MLMIVCKTFIISGRFLSLIISLYKFQIISKHFCRYCSLLHATQNSGRIVKFSVACMYE